ncbi:ABC transporter substrate-binding protein [Mangrovibacter sp. MFB070]|uniref:ABC transporter substrate-binding protein n=1 Tax=Mangrovibacter sp. MFB070 TaxID=1224318 RepID=UPI0004D8509D|nr:ABC transporter substrate-binding protein [Mangrovibacter sp. MFB070]KEA52323.1 ABC transporter substrate-binding protein [Mangrovibacter sp. MFB070]
MKQRVAAFLLCLTWLAGAAHASRQVVDDAGNTVTVPDTVTHIADGWFAHHSMLMTLGVGNDIVATVNHPDSHPWMFKIDPALNQALQVHGITFNSESLVTRHTDVLFVAKGNPDVAGYRQAGIPTLEMAFTDYPSMARSITTTANVIGTATARARAQAWVDYLHQTVASISAKTATLTDAQRPRVLHIQSLNPLKVDGSGTLIDTWIHLAGGRNAAAEVKGNMKEVSPEMVLYWQPDVIILGQGCGDFAHSRYASLFAGLNAVKQGRVWQNPAGVFPWDRYGTESALQIQWAAHKLHPELFTATNMAQITQDFYQRFFDYTLTTAQAQRILHAQPPEK